MATVEETRILHIEIDQGAAEKQLEKVEGILLDNKKAVQDLAAAYKKGNVTQEEYVKENIRLQQNIKKENELKKTLIKAIDTESNSRNALKNRISQLVKEYDNINTAEATGAKRADALEKELAQLNAQLTKGDKAAGLFKNQIGNYPKVLGDAASQIRVAGVSVSDVGTKIASLANPVTAAIGVIGALGSAYAHSTIGAKDFEFAQNQLAAALEISTNAFAEFISSAEDGEGILSKFTNGLLNRFNPALATVSKFSATLKEDLQDLGRLEIEVRANANQRIEENQDLLEKIADEQVSINDKLTAANTIEENLIVNKRNVLSVLEDQLQNLEDQLALNKNSEALQTQVAQKRAEINRESATLEKQITRINKQQDDLNRKLAEELELQRLINREKGTPTVGGSPTPDFSQIQSAIVTEADQNARAVNDARKKDFLAPLTDDIIKNSQARQDQFIAEQHTVEESEALKRDAYLKTAELQKQVDQARLQAATIIFNSLSQLAEEGSAEQKALALVSIAFDTAKAIAGATAASNDIPYPGNLVAMATSIATVLANIAQASQIISGFAEGGYTGDGAKHDVAGIVHKGEYVVPQSVNYSPAAQPHIAALENMRVRGYADGGFVANQSTAPVNQSLIMANALSRLPRPIVDVREVTRAQQRIEVRETSATLSV